MIFYVYACVHIVYWHPFFDCCFDLCFNNHEDISVLSIQLTLEIRDPTFSGPTLKEGVCEKEVVSWFILNLATQPLGMKDVERALLNANSVFIFDAPQISEIYINLLQYQGHCLFI
jgi:hypothetical protein